MPAKYEKFDAEVAAGRLWRAKEILTGRLRDADYDPQLFERYGTLLHRMHDDDAAGQYFFLAGITTGPEGELAKSYLQRRRNATLDDIWHSMPRSARTLRLPELALNAQLMLVSVGHQPDDVRDFFLNLPRRKTPKIKRTSSAAETSGSSKVTVLFWLLVMFVVLVVVGAAVFELFRIIDRLIFRLL